MLTEFFQDSDFIVVLQTGFGSGFSYLVDQDWSRTRKNLVRTPLLSEGCCSRNPGHVSDIGSVGTSL